MSNPESDAMQPFVKLFLAAAEGNDGRVGMRTLSRILKLAGVEKTPLELARDGWIVPVTADGKTKTGWYLAGEKMAAASDVPPDGPYEYAQWLVAKKEGVLAQKAAIQADLRERIAAVDAELAEIGLAEEALAHLRRIKERAK